jgi:antitoxin HigA-1
MEIEMKKLKPVHLGHLLHDIMDETGLSAYRLSKVTGLSQTLIGQIRRAQRTVTPLVALKLGRAFKQSPEMWLGIQVRYDLEIAKDSQAGKTAARIKPIEMHEGAFA